MSKQFAFFRSAYKQCLAKAKWGRFSDDEKIKTFTEEYENWLDAEQMDKRRFPTLPTNESARRAFILAILRELGDE